MAEPETELDAAGKPRKMVQISVYDEESLCMLVTTLIKSTIPVMAHDANGVADYDTVLSNKQRFMVLAERAYARYARARNERVRINALPPELLVRIVRFLPYATRELSMHVCHRWHSALSAEPTLWTHVALRVAHSEHVAARKLAAIQRRNSRDPLSVQVGCSLSRGYKYHLVAGVVGNAMKRIRELRIQCDELVRTAWLGVLTSPAPMLEVLVISQAAISGPLPALPAKLFRDTAPNLNTVDLVHTGLPTTASPALANVKRLSYTVRLSSTAEIIRAFELCPKLAHLSIQSETADHSNPPAGFRPTLESFTIHKQVGSGYEDAIAVSNRRNSRLNIFAPLPNSRDATLSGVDEVHTVVASGHINSTACHLVAYGAEGYTRSALNMAVGDLIWALANGRDFLADVREMHIHDHLWAVLENSGSLPQFSRLEHLALLFQTVSMTPFPRMFCLEAPARFSCLSLRTATFSAYQLCRVSLPARNVASWLPETVSRLVLCYTSLDAEDGLIPGVEVVRDYSHRLGWSVGDDVPSWGWQGLDGQVAAV
ncbi:hypothetical protein AURDEDRAFT_185659 [Auricularia subglabra TFB-10046 SS5]|nr:hypothetical protein AURDEDRAFT_185659 [Auricularia subglabra TFB-10046 SS5]